MAMYGLCTIKERIYEQTTQDNLTNSIKNYADLFQELVKLYQVE